MYCQYGTSAMWVLLELPEMEGESRVDILGCTTWVHQTKPGLNMFSHMAQLGQSVWLDILDILVCAFFSKRSSTRNPFLHFLSLFKLIFSLVFIINDKQNKFLYPPYKRSVLLRVKINHFFGCKCLCCGSKRDKRYDSTGLLTDK